MRLHISACCRPLPGDRIVGVPGPGGIIDIHTIGCSTLAEHDTDADRWVDLQWTPEAERNTFSMARLYATIRDAPGVLGQACTIMGEAGGNIVGVNMRHRHSDFFDVDFDLEVKDARHLTHVAAALRACPSVETVERAGG
jgi:GTP pyrophosphokinase/guanosine-3',5'-bis(diphosphate) 3'-pyrophosphohydrolase